MKVRRVPRGDGFFCRRPNRLLARKEKVLARWIFRDNACPGDYELGAVAQLLGDDAETDYQFHDDGLAADGYSSFGAGRDGYASGLGLGGGGGFGGGLGVAGGKNLIMDGLYPVLCRAADHPSVPAVVRQAAVSTIRRFAHHASHYDGHDDDKDSAHENDDRGEGTPSAEGSGTKKKEKEKKEGGAEGEEEKEEKE